MVFKDLWLLHCQAFLESRRTSHFKGRHRFVYCLRRLEGLRIRDVLGGVTVAPLSSVVRRRVESKQ